MRRPKPWFWEKRSCWYVQFNKRQHRLDPDEDKAWEMYGRLLAAGGLLSKDEGASLTVRESIGLFLDPKVRPGPTAYSRSNYSRLLARFATYRGNGPLASLTLADVLAYCESDPEWSSGYRHGIYCVLRTFTKWARGRGYIDANPLEGVPNPFWPSRRKTFMTREQFTKILEVATDENFKLLLRVLFFTGCRPGEAYKLLPRHLHASQNIATLGTSEHKTGRKTGRERVIMFPSDLMLAVRASARGDGEPVLRNRRGTRWSNRTVASRFKIACRKAGLPSDIVPYSGRHSFATEMVMGGESGPLVAKAMGHTDDRVMQSTYLHAERAMLSEMVERRAASPSSKPSKSQLRDRIKKLQSELSDLTTQFLDEGATGTASSS